ncbi:recombinase family protein, partial [Streptococcus dysgalactiae]|uniref:recombinase family protein n=1 Tax=Streptococcus dysgalactiae TaxID=1334 RepID=UPI003FD78FAE
YHIAKDLTEQGIPSPSGKSHWNATTIKRMLRNEKYKGDALLQKTYTIDFLTKKKNINKGELPQYYVENNHEAIVERETFDAVQQVLDNKGRKSSTTIFSSKLVCGDCGHFFGSKVWHSTSKYRRVIYRCNKKYNGSSKCSTPHVTEEEVKQWFVLAVNQVIDNRLEVIDNLSVLLSIGSLEVIDEQIKVLETEAEVVSQLVANLVSENAIIMQDQDKYLKKYNQLTSKYEGIVQEIESLELQRMKKSKRNKELQVFINALEKQEGLLLEFDEFLWETMIEHVTVSSVKEISIKFIDGQIVRV